MSRLMKKNVTFKKKLTFAVLISAFLLTMLVFVSAPWMTPTLFSERFDDSSDINTTVSDIFVNKGVMDLRVTYALNRSNLTRVQFNDSFEDNLLSDPDWITGWMNEDGVETPDLVFDAENNNMSVMYTVGGGAKLQGGWFLSPNSSGSGSGGNITNPGEGLLINVSFNAIGTTGGNYLIGFRADWQNITNTSVLLDSPVAYGDKAMSMIYFHLDSENNRFRLRSVNNGTVITLNDNIQSGTDRINVWTDVSLWFDTERVIAWVGDTAVYNGTHTCSACSSGKLMLSAVSVTNPARASYFRSIGIYNMSADAASIRYHNSTLQWRVLNSTATIDTITTTVNYTDNFTSSGTTCYAFDANHKNAQVIGINTETDLSPNLVGFGVNCSVRTTDISETMKINEFNISFSLPPDTISPTYTSNGTNFSVIKVNESGMFFANWSDETALYSIIFETNVSGNADNTTISVSGENYNASFIIDINLTRGILFYTIMYGNDTSGNINNTPQLFYIVANTAPRPHGFNRTAALINISNKPIEAGEDAVINYTFFDDDYDSETTREYMWFLNGVVVDDSNTTYFASGNYSVDDSIIGSIRVRDSEFGDWENTSNITVGDTTGPAISACSSNKATYTDNEQANLSCTITDNNEIDTSTIKATVNGSGGSVQVFTMSTSCGSDKYCVLIDLSVGNYNATNFSVNDVNSNLGTNETAVFWTVTAVSTSTGTSTTGGGSPTINRTNKKECSIIVNPTNLTFFRDDIVIKLDISNNESISISPIYNIDTDKFEVRGASSIIQSGITDEISIIRNSALENISNNGDEELIFITPTCIDVVIPIKFDFNSTREVEFSEFLQNIEESISEQVTQKISFFGLPINFYFITIATVLIVATLMFFMPTTINMRTKIFLGLFIIIILNVVLGLFLDPVEAGIPDAILGADNSVVNSAIVGYDYIRASLQEEVIDSPAYSDIIKIPVWIVSIVAFIMLLAIATMVRFLNWWSKIPIAMVLAIATGIGINWAFKYFAGVV